MRNFILFIYVPLILFSYCTTKINGALSILNERIRGPIYRTLTNTKSFFKSDVSTMRFFAFPYEDEPNITSEIKFGDKSSVLNSGIIPFEPIKILVHGFLGNLTHFSTCRLKGAYLNHGFHNIICLDWGKLAAPELISNESVVAYSFYLNAVKNVASVGRRLAEFIAFLIDSKVANGPWDFHLIGHSLGSHVVGSTGYFIQKMFNSKVGRITGLDPAGLLYGIIPKAEKLDPSDANFVDVIHSNSDFFGTSRNIGTVDFFAFGGRGIDQPSCRSETKFFLGLTALYCGHSLAVDYFERSIEGEKLVGCRCVKDKKILKPACRKPKGYLGCINPTLFGEFVNLKTHGQFYLFKKTYHYHGESHVENYDG